MKTRLLLCAIAAFAASACSDQSSPSTDESALDASVADAADAASDDAGVDVADVVELPEFACTQEWEGFALGEPERQTMSAFVAGPTGPRAPKRLRIDAQLAAFDADRQVDVVVYRRDLQGRQVSELQRVTVAQARRIAQRDDVIYVGFRAPFAPTVDVQRANVGTNEVQQMELIDGFPVYRGLNGDGVRVVVADSGIDGSHPDFHNWSIDGEDLGTRVEGVGPVDGSGHGTHVAGLIAGNGRDSEGRKVQGKVGGPYEFRGHAPGVDRLLSVNMRSFSDELDTLVDKDGHVFNHSHTFSSGSYDDRVASYDGIIRDGWGSYPPRPSVVAAANNGAGSDLWFAPAEGYYSVLTPGKNTICVGSVNGNDSQYAPASSMGPTFDGRIKPELVAPGHRDYRPLEGFDVAFEEVRLHAKEGSGAEDLVWRFDQPEETDGWRARGAYAEAEPADGELRVRAAADGQDAFILETGGVDADLYEKLTFRMNLDVEKTDTHRWPRFYVVRWDRDGDGNNDGFAYPRYAEDKKQPGWFTHELDLAGKPRAWKEQVHRLLLRPVVYDDRVRYPKKGEGYGGGSGTSLAAPVVTGAVALLFEQFVDLHGVDLETAPPLPSTIRALLVHTARDLFRDEPAFRDKVNPDTGEAVIYHEGPDFATGYGLLDARKAVDLVAAHGEETSRFREESIRAGEVHVYRIPAHNSAPLRVTLAWDDRPGDFAADQLAPKLVNDLDVVAVGPDGVGHSPWILDPLPIDPVKFIEGVDPIEPSDIEPARRCASSEWWSGDQGCVDRRNNLEQVVVDAPQEGWWEIRVRGFAIAEGSQSYSLVVTQACD